MSSVAQSMDFLEEGGEYPRAPTDARGEQTWPTHLFPTTPPPFSRQSFIEKDLNRYLPEANGDVPALKLRNERV